MVYRIKAYIHSLQSCVQSLKSHIFWVDHKKVNRLMRMVVIYSYLKSNYISLVVNIFVERNSSLSHPFSCQTPLCQTVVQTAVCNETKNDELLTRSFNALLSYSTNIRLYMRLQVCLCIYIYVYIFYMFICI